MERDILIHNCPLCSSERIEYRFIVDGRVISACRDCGHVFANPQPVNPECLTFTPLYSRDEISSDNNTVLIDNLDLVNDPVKLLDNVHNSLNDFGGGGNSRICSSARQ